MTADYNGWNDAPEAEREAMDVYSCQEFECQEFERTAASSRSAHGGSLHPQPERQ